MGYAVAFSVLLLYISAILVARKRKKKEIAENYPLFTHEEWLRAARDVKAWKRNHPLGPTTQEEFAKLEDLLLIEIGAYTIRQIAFGYIVMDPYYEQLMEETRDWRS